MCHQIGHTNACCNWLARIGVAIRSTTALIPGQLCLGIIERDSIALRRYRYSSRSAKPVGGDKRNKSNTNGMSCCSVILDHPIHDTIPFLPTTTTCLLPRPVFETDN